MILLGPLTKIEKEKLLALKEEIMRGFRKRVTPMYHAADGTKKPIPRRSPMRMVTKIERINFVDDIRLARARLNQTRGINYIGFLESIIREYAVGAGIPADMMREMRDADPMMRPPRRMTLDVDISNARLIPCDCINCSVARRGVRTMQFRSAPLTLPDKPNEMMLEVQLAGPLLRPIRRYASIGGFGSIMDTESGKDRRYRSGGEEMMSTYFVQAERNREMQYDERDWEI